MKEVPTAINLPQEETPPSSPSPNRILNVMSLSLLWLMIVAMFGSTGLVAVWLLTRVPPTPNCQELSPLAADGEQLYCVEQKALSGKLEDLEAAIAFAEQWGPNHALYAESQRLMTHWSRAILELARWEMKAGNLEKAIELAGKIPPASPLHDEAQTRMDLWAENWEAGQEIYQMALKAISEQNWTAAHQHSVRLSKLSDPFWSKERFLEVSQLIAAEKQRWQQLNEARWLANYGTVEDLVEAMEKANKIPADSLLRKSVDQELANWSRQMLQKAEERLDVDDLEGAIAIAKRIPAFSPRYSEAQDFIRLGAALDIAQKDDLGSFLLAQAEAAQIKSDRPLYAEAQAKIAQWQTQVQDEIQLQFAQLIAQVGQPVALAKAESFAQMIAIDRPRRIQAQTKVAHWRKEIVRLQDRPILARARKIAQGGTLADLEAARELAAQIQPQHPLRIQAQTLIAEWNKRIQIVEDGPILKQAERLAKAGDWWAAMEMAAKISSDRVLYTQAQAAIEGWRVQIQTAQDQADLRDAEYLGSLGQYQEAIRIASRVSWERPLYYQAQEAIARWQAKLDALYVPAPPTYQNPVEPEPVVQEPVYQPPVEPEYQEPVYQTPILSDPAPPEPVAPAPEPVSAPAAEPSTYTPEPELPN